ALASVRMVVLWRTPWDEHVQAIIETCRRHGARVVFDIDDLLIRRELARRDIIDGIHLLGPTEDSVHRLFIRYCQTMQHADHCVCPTETLAARADLEHVGKRVAERIRRGRPGARATRGAGVARERRRWPAANRLCRRLAHAPARFRHRRPCTGAGAALAR